MSTIEQHVTASVRPAPAAAVGDGRPLLPVDTSDGLRLDRTLAREIGARWSEQYRTAEPFPHIVVDNFFPAELAQAILANFPRAAVTSDLNYGDKQFEYRKRQVIPEDCNSFVRQLFAFMNSGAMLQFLEALTGIDGLIPDPYFEGGGFHEITHGGKLGLHADFRINRRLRLQRRLNLLLYLNQDWDKSYGGHLELWDQAVQRRVHSIDPLFNRCVVFNTDAQSYHGHPDPLNVPESVTRKSLALYYYTASEKVYLDVRGTGTDFVARPDDASSLKRAAEKLKTRMWLRLLAQESLPPVLYRQLRVLKARLKRGRPASQ